MLEDWGDLCTTPSRRKGRSRHGDANLRRMNPAVTATIIDVSGTVIAAVTGWRRGRVDEARREARAQGVGQQKG